MRHGLRFPFLALLLVLASCAGDAPTPDATPPAAPTGIEADPVEGGIEVTWNDASDDENGFRIYRDEGAARRRVGSVGPDVTSYLDATADPGVAYRFWVASYNGAGESSQQPHRGDPVTASPPTGSLAVERAGSGTGAVVSDPVGIDCGETCSANFARGTTVVLTAAPAPGSTFEEWQGACTGADRVCSVEIDAETTVTASFAVRPPPAPGTVRLTVIKTGDGTITSTPAGIDCEPECVADFNEGATVTLRATPGPDATFAGWSGACSGSSVSCTLTLDESATVGATFEGLVALNVNTTGSGSGRITSNPAGIDCGSDCSEAFLAGTNVTLAATPADGSAFRNWSGGGCGSSVECNVTMNQDLTLTARFERVRAVNVSVSGPGRITSDDDQIDCSSGGGACSGEYVDGERVTLTAEPGEYAEFEVWGGACSGSSSTCTVEVAGDASVDASFTATAIVVTSESGGSSQSDCTLRDAIVAANRDEPAGGCPAGDGADTIVLPRDAEIVLIEPENNTDGPNGLPSVYTEIEITGNGATIMRSEVADPFRIFHLGYRADLVLRNLTIQGGFDDIDARSGSVSRETAFAGGIFSKGDVTLVETTVTGNRSNVDESNIVTGGIFVETGSLTLIGSTVSSNSSSCFLGCNGGIHVLDGALEIRNSTLERNSSDGAESNDGTALNIVRGSAFIADSRFAENDGESDDLGGGAIAIGREASVEIVRSELVDNYAMYGDAIWNRGTVLVRDSVLNGNAEYGGVIYHQEGSLTVVNSEMHGGQALYGGALLTSGRALLSNTEITGCGEEGGVIFNQGELRLENDTHARLDCRSREPGFTSRGGVILNDSGTLVCTGSRIADGVSYRRGGGVENWRGSFTADGCLIEGNRTDGSGGGIFNNGDLEIRNSVVRANFADADRNKEGSGGGIYHEGEGDLRVSGDSVIGGSAAGDGNSARTGGGVFIGPTGAAGFLAIDDSTIVGNFADSHGGGIYLDGAGAFLDLRGAEVRGNAANIDGGGIYVVSGTANLYGTTVTENIADVNENGTGVGGGLYLAPGGTYRSERSRIEGNEPDDVFRAGEGEFEITLRFGSEITEAQKRVFRDAAARWAQLITDDVPDFLGFVKEADGCGRGEPAETGDVDDLVIYADVEPIDGPGGILGSAGPCFVRAGSGLPLYGTMNFDSADVARLESDGTFADVILHEMGHVLGVGTLWDVAPYFDLLQYSGSDCDASTGPIGFTGGNAGREYRALGGSGLPPVESDDVRGAKCGHWDETAFDDELMTGFVEAGGAAMPASRLTLGSLQDMGYGVAYDAADAYAIPSCSPGCLRAADGVDLAAREVVLRPVYALSPDGERIAYEEFALERRRDR